MFNLYTSAPWFLVALLATLSDEVLAEDPTATITTAPIFLPHYNKESWSAVRGSIISIDEAAQQTTYTIFCPDEDPPTCDISLEFPFELVEGPETVMFHGTHTSTYIANLECTLEGTTAATCSGYSSLKSGFNNGMHTGPTEVSWTSTFTESEMEFGVLTMAEVPSGDEPWDFTKTGFTSPAVTYSDYITIPRATGDVNSGRLLTTDWKILGIMGVLAVFRLV